MPRSFLCRQFCTSDYASIPDMSSDDLNHYFRYASYLPCRYSAPHPVYHQRACTPPWRMRSSKSSCSGGTSSNRLRVTCFLNAMQGGISVGDIDALVVCTCTGYICPGISSYLSQLLGIKVRRCSLPLRDHPPCHSFVSLQLSCSISWAKAVALQFHRCVLVSCTKFPPLHVMTTLQPVAL